MITILNFSPAIPNFEENELWKNVDILIINEIELEQLTKKEIKSVYHAKESCKLLINKLDQIEIGIICSMGKN